jgi:formylglycine-generating enzyme required for sulfatase activity
VYRLPTEAEREYAARGGNSDRLPYWFGLNDEELKNYAWYSDNSGDRTHAVATKPANPFGLYDMNGNVLEWVNDFYGDYPNTAVTDPTGPASGNYRVLRGGSWIFFPRHLRSAARFCDGPGRRYTDIGFRLVRSCR